MSVDDILELSEMAAKLERPACKLPQGLERDELLRDIERLRTRLTAQLSAWSAEK
jgi:hypothetical protein